MALAIIGLILVLGVGWGVWMSRTQAGRRRASRANRPRYASGRFRFAQRGETDVQRSERIVNSRERYDASIDRLDPRHPDFQERRDPAE